MSAPTITFDDGAVYERMMGKWSGLAGRAFIDWLSPPPNLRWVDIGCGNGAFTQLLVEHCTPMTVEGVDPSEGQLAFARERLATPVAKFRQGDAMALPFADGTFDAAVMALVVFFIPDPARGVAEMARVVRPGGLAAAAILDVVSGGGPSEDIIIQRRHGVHPPRPRTRKPQRPKGYMRCGHGRVSPILKRAFFARDERSMISRTIGPQRSRRRISLRCSQRWRQPT